MKFRDKEVAVEVIVATSGRQLELEIEKFAKTHDFEDLQYSTSFDPNIGEHVFSALVLYRV